MKKILALTVCIVQFLFSSCYADTATMTRIPGSDKQTHLSIVDNQVYVTFEKEGLLSNRYSIYAIVPYEEPYPITSYRGHYSLPVVFRGKWLVNKLDVTPLTHYINSSVLHTVGLDGSILPYDAVIKEAESSNAIYTVTNSMQYKTVRKDSVFHVMYWNEESHDWCDTGIQANDYLPRFFSSLVFSSGYGDAECQVFDAVNCDSFSIPRTYDGAIHGAILYEDMLLYVDNSSISSYEVTTGRRSIIYAYDQYPHENGSSNIFLEGESVYFADPNTKQIIRYDLATNEMAQTKAEINNCSEFVVVGDWVYSIKEDESNCLHLLMSNLLTGEECLSIVLAK